MFTALLSKIQQSPRLIFAVDGLGALLSTSLMGGLLFFAEGFFGIPNDILWLLWMLPLALCLFSLGNYLFNPSQWRPLLRIVAMANMLYCGLSLGLIIAHWEVMTPLGLVYLAIEKAIVIPLAILEWRWSYRIA